MNNKNGKIIGILLGIVIALVVAVLGFAGYKLLKNTDSNNTEQTEEKKVTKELSGTSSKSEGGEGELDAPQGGLNTTSQTRKKEYIEEYEKLGQIEIPKTNLKANILDETTKRSLEIGVTKIYTTGGINKPGNTVIYGHNYRNSLFFSKNSTLKVGDKVYITDMEKNKIAYEIYNIFETSSSDTTFYTRSAEDTNGKCEVTLSTCTDDASTTERRLIVQAREV